MSDLVITRVFVSTFGQDLIFKSSGMSGDFCFVVKGFKAYLLLEYWESIGRVVSTLDTVAGGGVANETQGPV